MRPALLSNIRPALTATGCEACEYNRTVEAIVKSHAPTKIFLEIITLSPKFPI
jgi:hypothetical protein